MKSNDVFEFYQIWEATGELYNIKPSKMAVELAFNSLSDFDLKDVARAIHFHIQNPDSGRFMPKPADIIKQIKGDTKTQSLTGWSQVEYAISRVGKYRSVTFDDPITMRVIEEMGGWIKICTTTTDEMPFVRNEFTARYSGYSVRGVDSYPARLLGIADAENIKDHPDHVEPPMLIGDAEKAKRVLELGSNESKPRMISAGAMLQDMIKPKSIGGER